MQLPSSLEVDLPEGSILLKPIAKAEYDVLSDEDRNSEVGWLVTDEEPDGSITNGGTSTSDTSSNEVYSEEEVRIGTWFGKPLYRSVIETTTPSTTGDNILIQSNAERNYISCVGFI